MVLNNSTAELSPILWRVFRLPKVQSVLKKRRNNIAEVYSHVSLIYILKAMKKCVHAQLISYLEKRHLIQNRQLPIRESSTTGGSDDDLPSNRRKSPPLISRHCLQINTFFTDGLSGWWNMVCHQSSFGLHSVTNRISSPALYISTSRPSNICME